MDRWVTSGPPHRTVFFGFNLSILDEDRRPVGHTGRIRYYRNALYVAEGAE